MKRIRTTRPHRTPVAFPFLFLPLFCLLGLTLSGCNTTATFRFSCDQVINGGLLLTVDLVQIDEADERGIREEGDNWFYSGLRRQLGARTRTLAVEGSCNENVTLTPIKGFTRLAVIADYQYEGSGGTKTQMEFYSKERWVGKTLRVRVKDTYLTISSN